MEQLSRMNTKKKVSPFDRVKGRIELVHGTSTYNTRIHRRIYTVNCFFPAELSLSLLSIRPCVSIEPCDKLGGYIGSMIELMTSLPPLLCVPINWHVDLRSAGGQEDHANHNVVPWEGQSSRRCEGNKMESVF